MAEASTASGNAMDRGIFDCDEAHRSPIRSDYERIFQQGTVVLDTNVLLNLYRSNESTRRDTLAALAKLRKRLWIPHQVLEEFWRNRELPSVRNHHATKASEASDALDKAVHTAKTAVNGWVAAVQLKDNDQVTRRIDEDVTRLATVVDNLKTFIRNQAECDALKETATTYTDPVLNALEPLLRGRIGEPLSSEEYDLALKEAQERADEEIPPGHEDFRTKPPELAAGDYLLWVQLMAEARRRACDVLLVTGDVKKDWWTNRGYDIPPRPRGELVLELRQKAGVELYMLTPGELLTRAKELLDLEVAEGSVRDLEQLDETASEAPMEGVGWTAEALTTFMAELMARYPSRVKAIVAAAANGGFVDRETVYERAGYSPTRMLRGFTQPIGTLARDLQLAGVLQGGEPFLLTTVYGHSTDPSWAKGFRIPPEVIPLLREQYEGTELWWTGGRKASGNEHLGAGPD
ncbi:PIN-like domain-containing protein [Streptomyces maoxianensis]|uniref:PIN-like domain-containing protein n=1 Tax=Streptomyces maoxianensis TaxID=1459942 RepID=A0ABV9G799_9ACTN